MEIVLSSTKYSQMNGLGFGFIVRYESRRFEAQDLSVFFGYIFCSELDMPFAKWTKEQVCNWLQDQGLGSYISNGRHWILSGQTLLQASQQDLEKVRNTGNNSFSKMYKN